MNTRNTKEFVLKRKPNLAPYINNPETEERLKVNCMHKLKKQSNYGSYIYCPIVAAECVSSIP